MKPRIFSCLASCAVARRRLSLVVLAALWLCPEQESWAQFKYADVTNGDYRGCGAYRSGDYYNAYFTVVFKPAAGNMAGETFMSRGIGLHAYDEKGGPSVPMYMAVKINNASGNYYHVYNNFVYQMVVPSYPVAVWMNAQEFTANVQIQIEASTFEKWPAVAVRAMNVPRSGFLSGNLVLDRAGALYLGSGTQGCQLIDPAKPPPSPVTTEIKVTAPDWDLGELERGKETTRTFATDAQRLCFSYDAKYIEYDKYLISVSNRNGVADNKFLLVNAADGSETVPYTLSFTGGGAPMALPSINGLPLTLGKSGRTCLTPTFKTWVGATIKGGDFSDALTFTITTQP